MENCKGRELYDHTKSLLDGIDRTQKDKVLAAVRKRGNVKWKNKSHDLSLVLLGLLVLYVKPLGRLCLRVLDLRTVLHD